MGVSRSTWYRRGNRISGELSKKVKKAQGKRNDKNFSAQTGEVEQVSLARASAFVRERRTRRGRTMPGGDGGDYWRAGLGCATY
jgi:hypothetical protein